MVVALADVVAINVTDERVKITLPPYCVARGAFLTVYCRTIEEYDNLVEWVRSQGQSVRVRDESGRRSVSWDDPDTPHLHWMALPPQDQAHEEFLDEARLSARYNRGR